jgi:cell division protein FtsA
MKNSFCAIDIGSSKIKILIVSETKEGLEVKFKAEENSEGVKRGTVVDSEKVSRILRNLISLANQNLKEKVNSAFVNLGGVHLFSVPTKGLISVSRADQTVSEEDVGRVLQEAKIISAGQNKEIFDLVIKEFILDGERGIKEPIGLRGTRLEVEALALGYFSPYLENLKKSLLNSNLDLFELIPSPIALAKATLKERQKEMGVCLVDLGAQTTSVSVFEDGNLAYFSVLPIGVQEVTNKIAIEMKIDPDLAERLKIEFGSCYFKGKNKREVIEIEDEEPLIFYPKSLAKIVREGYSSIFEAISKELKKISKDKKLPAGIVLTGGGAKISKILELAKLKFKLNCKIGKPKGILGLEEDPRFSLLAGLSLASLDFEEERGEKKSNFFSKIKRIFRIFLP